ncbi:16728_t:CDS:2 [Funneliformis mosseae]|uniref:16728_t:CDS:1 n=1 Tax=Funneliformis mosseae TaxID=27381 RepID=A0A9N8ZVZ6_FUNMO|nr:16728_t:CDS:2 [Funneliformis mosseae]
MPKIHSIAIRGIRCFSPSRCNEVNLDQPLTLIVGANGSGKTTIIEALRYATTGFCPPGTSKGKTFVMDPTIYEENEVKAQIKLEFTGIEGQEIVATRSMSMKLKKTTTVFQTLESLLEIMDNVSSTKISLTGRCAELDSVVPIHLGVSPAVLDFVIFCHQDESLWPLSEPSILKKKFDEIFESGKLSNIITDIKKDRKTLAAAFKECKLVFDHLMKERERAEKIQRRINQNKIKVEELSRKRDTYELQLNNVSQEIGELLATIKRLNQTEAELNIMINEKKQKEKALESLKNRMIESHESDEVLDKLIDKFDSNLRDQQANIEDWKQQIEKLEFNIKDLQSSLTKLSSKQMHLQVEYSAHERRLADRNDLMQKISRDCQFSNMLSAISAEESMQNLKSLLQSSIEEKKNKLEDERKRLQNEEHFLTDRLSDFKTRVSSLKQTRDYTTRSKESNKSKKFRLESEIEKICQVSDSDLKFIDASLETVKSELKKFEQDDLINEISKKIDSKQSEYNEIDLKLSRLQELSTNQAKLEYRRSEKRKITLMLQSTWEPLTFKLSELLNKDPNLESLEKEWDDRMNLCKNENKGLEQQRDLVDLNCSRIQAKIEMMKSSIETKSRDLQIHLQKVGEVCGEEEYLTSLKEAEDQLEHKQNEMNLFYGTSNIYEHYANWAEKEKNCPLCHHSFTGIDSLNDFIKRLRNFVTNLPEEQLNQERNLETIKTRCQRLRGLQQDFIAIRRLKSEISDLNQMIEKQAQEYSEYKIQLDEIDAKLALSQENMFNFLELDKEVQDAIKLKANLSSLDKEINNLEPYMRASNDSKNKKDEWREKAIVLRKDIKELNEIRDSRNREEKNLRERLHKLEMDKYKKQNDFDNRSQIQEQIDELNKNMILQERELSPLFDQITNLDNEIRDMAAELQEFRTRKSESEDAIMTDLNKLQTFHENFTKIEREIIEYVHSGKREGLDECTEQIKRIQQSTTEKTNNSNELKAKLHQLDLNIGQTRQAKRDLQDNRDYRNLKVEIENLQIKIEDLRQQLESQGSTNYVKREDFLQAERTRISSEISSITGNMEQIRVTINIDRDDLETQYKNIKEKFKDQWALKHGDQEAIAEIDRLISELDNILMNYHTRKMQEINSKIDELWGEAYNGDDIEKIEIRSEQENAQYNRSYNYRVVMQKNSKILDMRGRCSAGQRMLASIIIRMALAECFSKGFGMFVLDEPTTNLDENHINKLATSLRCIVENRRNESNFQLVVITHDDKFAEKLGLRELSNFKYRVEKIENGLSTIVKLDHNNNRL